MEPFRYLSKDRAALVAAGLDDDGIAHIEGLVAWFLSVPPKDDLFASMAVPRQKIFAAMEALKALHDDPRTRNALPFGFALSVATDLANALAFFPSAPPKTRGAPKKASETVFAVILARAFHTLTGEMPKKRHRNAGDLHDLGRFQAFVRLATKSAGISIGGDLIDRAANEYARRIAEEDQGSEEYRAGK